LETVVTLEPTAVPGAFVVYPKRMEDDRGFFGRVWCKDEFAAHGIEIDMVQASVSYSRIAGTVRALHFAWPPAQEGKLVRCERGRLLDVCVDLRPSSPAFLRHVAVELDESSQVALYIPPGVAHGFQTLSDATTVLYMMSERYRADLAGGVRFDDPAFGIRWPLPVTCIAERDRSYPDFDRASHAARFSTALVS
jgi:dTDP-4-dehydrorhamnose 3,5-epimerase